MGLSGLNGFANNNKGTCHWVATDIYGRVLDFDLDSPDKGVYVVDDDEWDGTYLEVTNTANGPITQKIIVK